MNADIVDVSSDDYIEVNAMDFIVDNLIRVIGKNSNGNLDNLTETKCRESIKEYLLHVISACIVHVKPN